jgi:hypothetical protein
VQEKKRLFCRWPAPAGQSVFTQGQPPLFWRLIDAMPRNMFFSNAGKPAQIVVAWPKNRSKWK